MYAAGLVVLQGVYAVFQTRGRMRDIAATQTGERLLSLAILGALVAAAEVTVTSAEIAIALAACVTAVVGIYASRADLRGDHAGDFPIGQIVRSVGPMSLVAVSAYFIAWIDIFVLDIFRSRSEVGVYAFAYQIATFVLQLGSLWVVATLPRHSRAAFEGVDKEALLSADYVAPALSLWSAGVAATAVIASISVPTVVGDAYTTSLGPLMILLAGIAPLGGYFVAVSVSIALDRTRMLAVISVACALLNILLDLALVPSLGIWGPAVATFASNVFAVVATVSILVGYRRTARILRRSAVPAAVLLLLAVDPRSPILLGAAGLAAASVAFRVLRSTGLGYVRP
jgi:O-antigen/teichoic acid export membrane protein